MIYTTQYDSPIGPILLAGDGESLTGLWFVDQKYFGSTLPKMDSAAIRITEIASCSMQRREQDAQPLHTDAFPIFRETMRWLDIYFRGEIPDFTPPLRLEGTPFRMAVWEILLTIPYGETVTYGEIAEKIAQQKGLARMSAQAVGGAVGHNPIGIIVPCHRVVGSDGSLTGYAGGLDKKAVLLELEKR